MTHLALGFVSFTVVVVSGVILASPSIWCCFEACLPCPPCRWFEQPPLFLAQSIELVYLSYLGLDVSRLSPGLDEYHTLFHGILI